MMIMARVGRYVLGVLMAMLFLGISTAAAARITSPNYQIDGNLGGSFGGDTGSSSYKMTTLGGEAIVGAGSSGSYILDQQQISSSAQTMQLGVQPGGLVGFYPMDENTGTTPADASRYQNDGSLNSAATWYANGKIGSAVDINGVSGGDASNESAVLIPDNENLPSGSAMTIEAWVKQDAYSAGRTIASHWYHADGGPTHDPSWTLETDHEHIILYIANSQSDTGLNRVETTEAPWTSYNTWRHIVAVYNGAMPEADRVKIYLDGTLMATAAFGDIPSSLRNASGSFSIGSTPGYNSAYDGAIDHVKLFNRALSAAEVAAEYTAQNAGSSSGFGLEPTLAASTTSAIDAIVRTNSPSYTIGVQQDHDLQSGADTIAAIGSSITSPATWSEGTTRGFGFTLTAAPALDAKWSSGSKYAAVPNATTTFYSGTGNENKAAEVVSMQLRLHPSSGQPLGTYSNSVTYTGTMTP